MTGRPRVALLAFGLTLLVVAWIAATVPFSGPDEASHYLRALAITKGQILGPKVNYPPPPGLTPTQDAFVDHDTREVIVPARLSPPNVGCIGGKPDLSGSCYEANPNGNFPPLGYILPAVALSVSHDASTGLWLTRAASAVQSLAFLLLAVALLWNASGWSLLGLLAASTPMVLFVASVLNTSGIQITACLAFAAAVLRITRAPTRAPRWVWVAFGLAGAVAILTGPIGLEFTIADAVLFGVLLGRRGLDDLRQERQLRVCALTLLAAAVVAFIYSRIAGFSEKLGISPLWSSLKGGVHQLWEVLQGAVGNFASLTVPVPLAACWIWWLLVVALLAGALRLGDRRERRMLAAVTVLVLVFPVLFWAWFDRLTGFGLEAREVLPPLMLIPLLAGEVIFRHRAVLTGRRSARLALSGAIALIALFQAYAWWLSARAAAGAPGTIRFYAHATWSPPLGWMPWIALAALGTIALLGFAATEAINHLGPPATDDERRRQTGDPPVPQVASPPFAACDVPRSVRTARGIRRGRWPAHWLAASASRLPPAPTA